MMQFSYDRFVDDVRAAAAQVNAGDAVRALLCRVVSDTDSVARQTPTDGDDEIHLFEDDSVSIWHCRFQPHILMPPHEHRLPVFIAGFGGVERNLLFTRQDGRLRHLETRDVGPGDVLALNPQDIHAVGAAGDQPSYCLHVYLGPLMRLQRNLFNWDSGAPLAFSIDAFDRMKRQAADVPHEWGATARPAPC